MGYTYRGELVSDESLLCKKATSLGQDFTLIGVGKALHKNIKEWGAYETWRRPAEETGPASQPGTKNVY